jgi:P27 family predicted phage terminase small subunit
VAIPGKKPTPTKLKMLHGNPGRRAIHKNEARLTRGLPRAPRWLDRLAKREWRRIVPELDAVGLLSRVDGFVLEAYCTCYGRWVAAEQTITRIGTVYQPSNKKGSKYLQQVPHVSIAQKYLAEARAFAEQLGLSPSARSRIDCPSSASSGEDDDLD